MGTRRRYQFSIAALMFTTVYLAVVAEVFTTVDRLRLWDMSSDITVGWWHIKYMSGAIPEETKQQWLDNINQAICEVRIARGKANEQDVPRVKLAESLYARIFGQIQEERAPEPASGD